RVASHNQRPGHSQTRPPFPLPNKHEPAHLRIAPRSPPQPTKQTPPPPHKYQSPCHLWPPRPHPASTPLQAHRVDPIHRSSTHPPHPPPNIHPPLTAGARALTQPRPPAKRPVLFHSTGPRLSHHPSTAPTHRLASATRPLTPAQPSAGPSVLRTRTTVRPPR